MSIIDFLNEYQSTITAIVITATIIYVLYERWLEKRKLDEEKDETFIKKKR
jgi:hypothetical protein